MLLKSKLKTWTKKTMKKKNTNSILRNLYLKIQTLERNTFEEKNCAATFKIDVRVSL